jgi:hypothetical protein
VIKLAFTGITDSEVEFKIGWLFVFVTISVMAGNVLNLLPLIINGYRRLMAKIRYQNDIKRRNIAMAARLESKRISDEQMKIEEQEQILNQILKAN